MGNATKYHPLTGEPIRPLWIRPDGRAMWPMMGGDDTVPPADPPPADPPPSDPPADPADDGKGGKTAILADLATERDKRQALETQVNELQTAQQQQMDAIAKALGLKQDDTPDPEALAAQLSQRETEASAARRELAVFKAAPALEANAAELLDSASFLRSIAEIDPSDTEKLTTAIKAAVDGNAKFKAVQPPTTPPFPGGPRTPAPVGAGSLGEAIANKMGASQSR